jgi:hypothetical protein
MTMPVSPFLPLMQLEYQVASSPVSTLKEIPTQLEQRNTSTTIHTSKVDPGVDLRARVESGGLQDIFGMLKAETV